MKATYKDKATAVKIISASLVNIPSTDWITGNSKRNNKHFKTLAEYMFDVSLAKKGVHLSSCKTGVLLMFRADEKINPFKLLFCQLKLIHNCIGYWRFLSVIKRESYIKLVRPKENNYLYIWFWGVLPGVRGNGAAIELKDFLMNVSKTQGLPILAETTLSKNKKVYERYGFSTYHTWVLKKINLVTWFMKLSDVK